MPAATLDWLQIAPDGGVFYRLHPRLRQTLAKPPHEKAGKVLAMFNIFVSHSHNIDIMFMLVVTGVPRTLTHLLFVRPAEQWKVLMKFSLNKRIQKKYDDVWATQKYFNYFLRIKSFFYFMDYQQFYTLPWFKLKNSCLIDIP